MRIVTTVEQLLYDLLQEQKRTNELLEKLVPAPAPAPETPQPESTEDKGETATVPLKKRGR